MCTCQYLCVLITTCPYQFVPVKTGLYLNLRIKYIYYICLLKSICTYMYQSQPLPIKSCVYLNLQNIAIPMYTYYNQFISISTHHTISLPIYLLYSVQICGPLFPYKNQYKNSYNWLNTYLFICYIIPVVIWFGSNYLF